MRFVFTGNSQFLKKNALPAMEELGTCQLLLTPEDYELETTSEVSINAVATDVPGWLIPMLFVGSWAATKALDELYDFVLPVLRKHLSVASKNQDKLYALSFLLNKAPENVSILVVAVGTSAEHLSSSELLVRDVVPSALEYAKQLGKAGEVHLYTIENGKADVRPQTFNSIQSALRCLMTMYAAKPPRKINTRPTPR